MNELILKKLTAYLAAIEGLKKQGEELVELIKSDGSSMEDKESEKSDLSRTKGISLFEFYLNYLQEENQGKTNVPTRIIRVLYSEAAPGESIFSSDFKQGKPNKDAEKALCGVSIWDFLNRTNPDNVKKIYGLGHDSQYLLLKCLSIAGVTIPEWKALHTKAKRKIK